MPSRSHFRAVAGQVRRTAVAGRGREARDMALASQQGRRVPAGNGSGIVAERRGAWRSRHSRAGTRQLGRAGWWRRRSALRKEEEEERDKHGDMG